MDHQCVFPVPPYGGRPDSGILDLNAKGISLATDAGVLSADENVFLAGTGLEHVRKTDYYFLHGYRRQKTTKH